MKIYDANGIREWDQFTIQNEPISSLDLMERAAKNCTTHLLGTVAFDSIHFFCGKGNNGGDGLVMARKLHAFGKKVKISICEVSERGTEDFEANLSRLSEGIEIEYLNADSQFTTEADTIVDCLFGSGLNRPIEGWLASRIEEVNESGKVIVSVDIPSGLFVEDNSQNPLQHVIKADYTFSFQIPKFAFFFAPYEAYTGVVKIVNIGLSAKFSGKSIAELISVDLFADRIQSNFIHKGSKGFLTFIGGSENMVGAALLSSLAAFRAGCGYVGVYCDADGKTALFSRVPEAIYLGSEFIVANPKTKAIAIGPGLGLEEKSLKAVENAFASNLPVVLDADGINLLAANEFLLRSIPKGTILTPHLKELERLVGKSASPEEFLDKQVEFSKTYQVYIVQKGAWSKLTTPTGQIFINPTGNPGMATAGMGDALTGIIGSFLAQGLSPFQAAMQGIYYHGKAGDIVSRDQGQIGIITRDVINALPKAMNGF